MDARTRDSVPASSEAVLTGAPAAGSTAAASLFLSANNIVVDGFRVEGTTNTSHVGGIVIDAGTGGHQIQNNIVQNDIARLLLAASGGTSDRHQPERVPNQ